MTIFSAEAEYWNVTVRQDYDGPHAYVECFEPERFAGDGPDVVDMRPEELEAFGLALYRAADALRQVYYT